MLAVARKKVIKKQNNVAIASKGNPSTMIGKEICTGNRDSNRKQKQTSRRAREIFLNGIIRSAG